MSERTERDYATAIERIALAVLRQTPAAGAQDRAVLRALVAVLKRESREQQYAVRTRVGLTVAHRVLKRVSERLDREVLYK